MSASFSGHAQYSFVVHVPAPCEERGTSLCQPALYPFLEHWLECGGLLPWATSWLCASDWTTPPLCGALVGHRHTPQSMPLQILSQCPMSSLPALDLNNHWDYGISIRPYADLVTCLVLNPWGNGWPTWGATESQLDHLELGKDCFDITQPIKEKFINWVTSDSGFWRL